MMLKASTKLTTQYTLGEEDITVSKQQETAENLTVTTELHAGGHFTGCTNKSCCKDGNKWIGTIGQCWDPTDSGTGDWD